MGGIELLRHRRLSQASENLISRKCHLISGHNSGHNLIRNWNSAIGSWSSQLCLAHENAPDSVESWGGFVRLPPSAAHLHKWSDAPYVEEVVSQSVQVFNRKQRLIYSDARDQ
jgi:hypothetical protein